MFPAWASTLATWASNHELSPSLVMLPARVRAWWMCAAGARAPATWASTLQCIQSVVMISGPSASSRPKPTEATMALLNGQTYDTDCPYFWGHCDGSSCDGCEADQEQSAGRSGPPWAEGTSDWDRQAIARAAAGESGTVRADALWRSFSGWKA